MSFAREQVYLSVPIAFCRYQKIKTYFWVGWIGWLIIVVPGSSLEEETVDMKYRRLIFSGREAELRE